jgi:hypothetical protein
MLESTAYVTVFWSKHKHKHKHKQKQKQTAHLIQASMASCSIACPAPAQNKSPLEVLAAVECVLFLPPSTSGTNHLASLLPWQTSLSDFVKALAILDA